MQELDKTYTPQNVEGTVYKFWEEGGYFRPEIHPHASATYSIVIPPPNVTGVLHMGHAIDNTLQDILVRYNRMLGKAALWVPGTDHAGIATQNVVEKELRKNGMTRHHLGRDAFVQEIWKWVTSKKSTIISQLKRLGVSVDWTRERFTLDEGCSRAVREVFVDLYNKGLIYQGEYIVNWCPRCQSAISDIETTYKETQGNLWEISYPLVDELGAVVVATTRPETIYGDVAIAVNPQDFKYKHLIGKKAALPLVGRHIPIIADEHVDTTFGTGAVKVTPAHDPNDFEIGQRHNLQPEKIMDASAHMLQKDYIPPDIRDLSREEARIKTVEILDHHGQIVSIKEHTHNVGHCQRCDTVIEPYLSKQWFVKMKPLAEKAIQAVHKEELVFVPERWSKIYLDWMENVRDWCISRQLWWGHQIPAYYCFACKKLNVAVEKPQSCDNCSNSMLVQDPDVLDTWFSSGLWPLSTMGWPSPHAKDFQKFFPTNTLVTAFDIIFFWVARMVTMSYQFTDKSPFKHVFIHGLIRDKDGKKMSKSSGNTIDPVEMIEKYGADALRFTLTSLATYGAQDIKLSDQRFELGRNFANKLWNASRFVMLHLNDFTSSANTEICHDQCTFIDQWILNKLNQESAKARQNIENFRIGEYAQDLYEFVWNDFCDWYVELAKVQLANPTQSANTKAVLFHALDATLKLLHPIMPFITEELWQNLHKTKDRSIMIEPFPSQETSPDNTAADHAMALTIDIIKSIRNIRQELNVPPSKKITLDIYSDSDHELLIAAQLEPYLNTLVKADNITLYPAKLTGHKPQCAVGLVSNLKLIVHLAGLIELDKEIQRQQKKIDGFKKEKTMLLGKISNPKFLANAPQELVEQTQERLQELDKLITAADLLLQSLQTV